MPFDGACRLCPQPADKLLHHPASTRTVAPRQHTLKSMLNSLLVFWFSMRSRMCAACAICLAFSPSGFGCGKGTALSGGACRFSGSSLGAPSISGGIQTKVLRRFVQTCKLLTLCSAQLTVLSLCLRSQVPAAGQRATAEDSSSVVGTKWYPCIVFVWSSSWHSFTW